jgi:hypothetical protein
MKQKTAIAIIIAILVIAAASVWYLQTPPSSTNNSLTTLQDMTLTLVALNGTTVSLDSNSIAELPSFTSKGGLMTSVGTIKAVNNYTGVKLTSLCDLIGGISSETSVRVTASDGYSMIYSYDQLCGDFVTYNPKTGNEIAHNQTLTPIVAYHINGENLDDDEGPLRFLIVGPEGLITDGHYWIKFTEKIEILPAIRDWSLQLVGAKNENLSRVEYESGVICHGETWTDEDGEVWEGIPLWLLAGRVDDDSPNHMEKGGFNRSLAYLGYTIQVITGDGYTAEFDSERIAENDEIILADTIDGETLPEPYWPLRLVGSDVNKAEMLRNVIEIRLIFEK